MARLRFRDRLVARAVGRDVWIAKQTDSEVALKISEAIDAYDQAAAISNRKERREAIRQVCQRTEPLFRGSHIDYGIDPATVWLLIQIAILLWKWWQSRQELVALDHRGGSGVFAFAQPATRARHFQASGRGGSSFDVANYPRSLPVGVLGGG